jgi:hypothetical protein
MAFKKRRMIFVPDVHPRSFVFFFERGNSGTSWSIRDYSVKNRVKEYSARDFRWTAAEIHQKAQHSLDAPTHHTDDLMFWYEHTAECNRRLLGSSSLHEEGTLASISTTANCAIPVLNLPQLMALPKGRKNQDIERILQSHNSEDWVTWNFFQIMLGEYPTEWWNHLLTAARIRNPDVSLPFHERLIPVPHFWSSFRSPSLYEAQSRARMLQSGNAEWISRASDPAPVEGSSEIDILFDHDEFLIYVEAKLGSDISMRTTFDPHRNQIIRNIDCLLANAGNRLPAFWMLAKDEEPNRAYVQLMRSYKADPGPLIRHLPHRDPKQLEGIAQNLTILLWSDFEKLVCHLGFDPETSKVKQELMGRIIGCRSNVKYYDKNADDNRSFLSTTV